MSKPDRFSDGQYKNWLKCSQSLIIMKEALHDYIDKEVTKLHGDITLKVSSIPCGSSTGNQCGSCSWKNIKLTRVKPGTWSINCKNSICDKWLHQILAVHDDPHNPTLNWKNAVISKWPTDCYHVAKIFMPKGQDKTTKMPEDLDAPAILSLMKYCNWFRKDLPNSQILSDLIEIRNKVLHSGDLRIIDGDKDSWIDLMIQLLNELNIHGDACIELKKLKTDDIDINFRETEIRVLQKMVSDLVSDLTKVKRDMVSLQNFQSDLSEEMEKLRDNTAETTGKVDTVEADTEGMRKALEELKNIADKMVTFFDKNPDILDINITETIRNIDRDVQDQQRNLFRVETELKVRVSSLEVQMEKHQEETKQQIDIYQEETKQQIDKHQEETKQQIDIHQEETKQQIDKHQEETNQQIDKHQDETKQQIDKHQEETKQQIEETKKQVEGLERRIFAVEERKENNEQLSLQRDPTKRRQESYGLKQLKKDPRKRRPESDELKQLKMVKLANRFLDLSHEEKEALEDETREYIISRSQELPPLGEHSLEEYSRVVSNLTNPATGKLKLELLCRLSMVVLSLQHSNADTERTFSILHKIQSDSWGNLDQRTIESLLRVKLNNHNECHQWSLDSDLVKETKNAIEFYKRKIFAVNYLINNSFFFIIQPYTDS